MNPQTRGGAPTGAESGLVRAVGFGGLTASVINVIVGGGIFMLPAALFIGMGPAAPLAFVAGALVIVPVALCFAAAGSRVTSTGGPYSYVGAAFGPFAGFVAGALMWITNVTSSAGVAAALTEQARNASDLFDGSGPRGALLLAVYAVLVFLNAKGVRIGTRAIVVLATLKLTPLFLLALIGAWVVDWAQVSFTALPSFAALGSAMVLVMFAYSGMETALIPSGEVKDPSRDVPRATMTAILLVVLLYIGIQVVAQGALGAAIGESTAPVAQTAGALWGPGFGLLLATASVSMLGFLMGNLLGSSRMLYALGRDGWLPGPVGRLTASRKVPLVAVCIHGGVAFLLALGGDFQSLALISGGAICLVYVGVSLAAWQLQRRGHVDQGAPLRLPGGPVIPLVAAVAMLAILTTLKPEEWQAIGWSLATIVGLYLLLTLLRRR
ncbi:MAG: APC family permease [Pseudomonadota bacterium]|jgi:APA family basic amino acid/polyamine antiporter